MKKQKLLRWFFGILLLVVLTAVLYIYPQLKVLNGYAARTMCTCHFAIQRTEDQILKEDLGGGLFGMANLTVDPNHKRVSSTAFGLAKKTAIYKPGIGCILLKNENENDFEYRPPIDTFRQSNPWVSAKSASLSEAEIQSIHQLAFDKDFGCSDKKTRALLILRNDSLIYEQYAVGADANTPLLGWSMTKSVLSTLYGILSKEGKIKRDNRIFANHPDPNVRQTTIADLLQMRAGLAWEEEYDQYSTATQMLFDSDDIFAMTASLPFEKREWEYSSGTSNLLSGLIKKQFKSEKEYLDFPYKALFHALDLENAWIETDEKGTMIASSYMYATARDWLKLGMLYLKNGNYGGHQIIEKEWVDFVKTEAPGSEGRYGGHFWLNKNGVSYKDLPPDLYTMDGYQGQLVAIFPTQNMVVVRLGLSDLDFNQLLKQVVDAVEN